jgi:hypothetical protein
MATFTKFNAFIENLGKKLIDLNGDTLKVALTNTAPTAATDDELADITQVANGNGYTTGGTAVASNAYSQTSGTGKLTGNDVVFTASGSMGPFRYAALYSDTSTGDKLIGYWDYGSSITLASGETFTVDFDATNGILQIA